MTTRTAHEILMEVRRDPNATREDRDFAYRKYLRALTVQFKPAWKTAIRTVGTRRESAR